MEIGAFIDKWLGVKGGAERANYQLFLTEFAQALALPSASPGEQGVLGSYQFDGPVPGVLSVAQPASSISTSAAASSWRPSNRN